MALRKKGKYWYGTTLDDIRQQVEQYSESGYRARRFRESVCECGNRIFRLRTDEVEGAGERTCTTCGDRHLMGDSAEFAASANLERHECICGSEEFELLSGIALYSDSNDVRWYYIGCRCTACNLIGVFADWKCEAGDAESFLAKV